MPLFALRPGMAGCLCAATVIGALCAPATQAAEPSALDRALRAALTAESLSELSSAITALEAALPQAAAPPASPKDADFARKTLAMVRSNRGTQLSEGMIKLASENAAQHQAQISSIARQALADFEQAAVHNPKLVAPLIGAARILALPGGDRARAVGALEQALKLEPKNADALRLRGIIRVVAGQSADALADFDELIKLNSKDVGALEGRAAALAATGKVDEAEKALAQAIEAAPKSPSPRLARARLHASRRNLDGALADLNEVLALQPQNIVALAMRVGLWEQTGKAEPLLLDLDRLVRLQPQAVDVHRSRAALLMKLGRLDTAIEGAERGLAAETQEAALAARRLELGMLYQAAKDPAKAAAQFTAAMASEPLLMAALIGRGDALGAQGKYEQAVADYNRVIERNSKETYVLNNLAWILATAPDDAVRDGRRAVELSTEACRLTDNKVASFLSTQAAAFAEKGDFARAVATAEKAESLAKGPEKESIASELASYRAEKPWREEKK